MSVNMFRKFHQVQLFQQSIRFLFYFCILFCYQLQSFADDPELNELTSETFLEDGWYILPWFGIYYKPSTDSNWLYHTEHRWLYLPDGSNSNLRWHWDNQLGWVFTSYNLYPLLFRHETSSWLYYEQNSIEPRRFYDYSGMNGVSTDEWLELYFPPQEGKNWQVVSAGKLDLIWVGPGSFLMGSPVSEEDRKSDEDQFEVTISKGYWLGEYEVTQAQYKVVMNDEPSYFVGVDRPVEQVSWIDAMEFCNTVNTEELVSGRVPSGYTYTLPTEAEWEYACRAGTTTPFSIGDGVNLSSQQANFNGYLTQHSRNQI